MKVQLLVAVTTHNNLISTNFGARGKPRSRRVPLTVSHSSYAIFLLEKNVP